MTHLKQAGRLTIELDACEDVLKDLPPASSHHAEERAIYTQARILIQQIKEQQP